MDNEFKIILDRYSFNGSGFSNENGIGFTNSTKYSGGKLINSIQSIYEILPGFT